MIIFKFCSFLTNFDLHLVTGRGIGGYGGGYGQYPDLNLLKFEFIYLQSSFILIYSSEFVLN